VFVIGIDKTKLYGGCVTVSALIQYFILVAVMWMGAEAVLMFQKVVIVFVHITTRYIIAVSFICWCKWKLEVCNSSSAFRSVWCSSLVTLKFTSVIYIIFMMQWLQLHQL